MECFQNVNCHSSAVFIKLPRQLHEQALLFRCEKFDVQDVYCTRNMFINCLPILFLPIHVPRYHKKYLTWFQRHDQPKVTTDEYAQGVWGIHTGPHLPGSRG